MKRLLFVLIALVASFLYAEPAQEIRVHLPTMSPLQSIYVARLQGQLSASYLNDLEGVLRYDLNYNGDTSLLPISADKEKLLSGQEGASPFASKEWKASGIPYAVKWSVQHNTLSAYVYSAQTGSVKSFSDISLTGSFSSDRRQIHRLADAIYKVLFNKDGIASSRILFSYQVKSEGQEWASEIWECDWDGANQRQITHDGSYCVTPVCLPATQDRFLYVSYKQGLPKIYIASIRDGVGKRLVDLGGNQLLPAISPKKDKLAFICDAAGRTDLFLQSFHPETGEMGKPAQLFSYPRATQASPTFSPDGSRIAFVSDKDSGTRIYLISASLTEKRPQAVLISKQNKENSCPAWSPDGTKLAYSAKTEGTRQIWIYDFATGEEKQLTSGPGNKENPAWAANSRHIVFNSTDANSSDLYMVNLNQPEVVKITKGPGKKHYPTWASR